MSSNHFHVTLPSDSSVKYYPDNTVSHFITKLSDRIYLSGEFEVGLSEIIFPYYWNNVESENKLTVKISFNDQFLFTRVISNGFYPSEQSFLEDINMITVNNDNIKIKFKYSDNTKKVTLNVECEDAWEVCLSPELEDLLGFEQCGSMGNGIYEASNIFDLNSNLQLMYIYTDIVKYSHVGDITAPLLRVCNVEGKYGKQCRITYTHPHYIQVERSEIENIEIGINTELGQPMPYLGGKAVCTLHFRKRHSLMAAS